MYPEVIETICYPDWAKRNPHRYEWEKDNYPDEVVIRDHGLIYRLKRDKAHNELDMNAVPEFLYADLLSANNISIGYVERKMMPYG